ncbi:MAG: hypothetical protein R2698_12805 [Microthrixaceae bacterium]
MHIVAGVDGSGDRIAVRHWERGVGLTSACGSGATAAAALARRWGLVGDDVTVSMPGGTVFVELRDGPAQAGDVATVAVLTGPATHIARCEVQP